MSLLSTRLDRRAALGWTMALAAAPLALSSCSRNNLAERVRNLFNVDENLGALAAAHRAELSLPPDTDALLLSVLGDALPTAPFLDDEELAQAIRDAVADDAFRGAFVIVDGWTLPKSLLDLVTLSLLS